MSCFELTTIINKAFNVKATDIHISLCPLSGTLIQLRRSRTLLQKELLCFQRGKTLVDYITYLGNLQRRAGDLRENFFHFSFEYQSHWIRAALSLRTSPYLSLRLHQQNYEDNVYQNLAILEPMLNKQFFISIVGPINSGKTTLYYKILDRLYKKEKTILSLEEPIEKYYPFWQVSLNNHQQWLNVFEDALRFDLDCIGFCEIRHNAYFKLLGKLFYSGHSIISTFHCLNIEQWKRHQPWIDTYLEQHLTFLSCDNLSFTLIKS